MTLETFFEKFDLLADAPDAVKRMRELIFSLAIQGKLVPQDPNDEPAIETLDDIESEKAALIEARKLRPNRVIEISQTKDLQYEVPDLWRWFRLGDVAFFQEGPGIRNWQFRTQGIKLLNVQNIVDGRLVLENTDRHISAEEFESAYRHFAVETGDILFASSGASWGKTAWFVNPGYTVMLNTSMVRLKFYSKRCDDAFLLLFLRTEFFKTQMEIQLVGIQPNFGSTHLWRVYIPLPPLAEQRRIVAKVDELMALCDQLEAQQQEREKRHAALARASLARFAESPTPANLQFLFHPSYTISPADLRKCILTLAVQGLLVPHDAESAGWETRKLKDLTTKIGSGSTPSGGRESYQEAGVPLIRSMNVHFGGFVRHGLAFLNEEQAEKLKNVTVKADDVLLNITGASIGRVATAPKDMEGARVNQHVCILRPTAEIIPPFLELFLASPVVQNLIDDVQVGATREALTKAMIEQFEIPVPSLAEQFRIVAKVDELMALVDALEQQLAASRATAANLLTALIAALTAGKEAHASTEV